MQYIRVKKAAEILRVNRQSFRRWDVSGYLKPDFVRPNGERLYDEERIRAIAAAGRLDPKKK